MPNSVADAKRRKKLTAALAQSENSITGAAEILGVTRATVYAWMKRYGIVITRKAITVLDGE